MCRRTSDVRGKRNMKSDPGSDRTVNGDRQTGQRAKNRMARLLAGLSAVAVVAGSFVGLSTTVASAATTPVTLAMTSGAFGVQNNPPATLPPPGSITGQ